jgi:hypothetical protein
MGVTLANNSLQTPIEQIVAQAKKAAQIVTINY